MSDTAGIKGRPVLQLVGSTQTYEQEGDCWGIDGQMIKVEMTDCGGGSYWVIETEHAAGMDLRAAIDDSGPDAGVIWPREWKWIATGLEVAIPAGFEGQVRPRSGLAVKHGVTVLNAPGTIDADYRGEILVILINHSDTAFRFRRGDRIAQLVIAPVARAVAEEVDELPSTARGAGGFGSTGR